MFLLSLNKTGLWTMLVLQLLCLSLYPACGRPSFEDEDEDLVEDEDHEKEEDLVVVDDQDESEDEVGNEEEDPKTSDTTTTQDSCDKSTSQSLVDCLKSQISASGSGTKSIEECAGKQGKSYIDCLKDILAGNKKGSKSGSGEKINWDGIDQEQAA